MTNHQPPGLHRYLARHGFIPHPGNSTWLDHDTGQRITRVLHQPGETTLLYCLDPHSACLYEAVFSPGTPETVIIAAIEATLRLPPDTGTSRPAPPPKTRAGGHRRQEGRPR